MSPDHLIFEAAFQAGGINAPIEVLRKFTDQVTQALEARCAELRRLNEQLRRDAQAFRTIRMLMGYVENGSETTVRLFQDDATREFFVGVGRQHDTVYGTTIYEAIEQAIARWPEEN